MAVVRKKKSPTRRASGKTQKSSPARKGRKGFWPALILSALTSFQITSCTLNPNWNAQVRQHLPDLATIPWPDRNTAEAPAATDSSDHNDSRSTGAVTATQFSQCPQFFPGQPPLLDQAPGRLRELCFGAFAVLHSGQTRTPVFVVERLNRTSLRQAAGVKRSDHFYADARLPSAERAELGDYRGSGYSRGHMAPAADMPSAEAMAQSFSLANMVPQNQQHNGGPWAKIEDDTRKYAARARGDVYVFTGPVFDARPTPSIGGGRVQVPGHLFKLVYDASTGKSWAHWQQNAAGQQSLQPISYATLVARTGLHLIPALESAR